MGFLDDFKDSFNKEVKEEKRQRGLMEKYNLPQDYTGENNGKYEYMVKYVFDEEMGFCYVDYFEAMLNNYANEGWRVKTIFTNEVGVEQKEGKNATIDVTVVVFERENLGLKVNYN